MNIHAEITDYLLADKIAPHFNGFYYLDKAIKLYRPGISMTKELYPRVASFFDTTGSRVERAIRYAREHSESGHNMPNSEYIARIALMAGKGEGAA